MLDAVVALRFDVAPTDTPDAFTVSATVNSEKSTVLPEMGSTKVAFPVPAAKRLPAVVPEDVAVPAPPTNVLLEPAAEKAYGPPEPA
jgi:hypothetical protein